MIVHDVERWVYLGVPKTASTALHRYLVEVRGARQVAAQHSMEVPEEYRGWLVFATSLNPFRRAHSLWRMYQSDHKKGARWTRAFAPFVLESFETFVETLFFSSEVKTPVFQLPMTAWLARVPEEVEVAVVPAEAMQAGLRELGVGTAEGSVPIVNRTPQKLVGAFSPQTVDAVRRWAQEDFQSMGYPYGLDDWERPPRRTGPAFLSRWLGSRVRWFRKGRPSR